MNFKKIISLICAVAILCSGVSAFTPIFPEEETTTQEQSGDGTSSSDEAVGESETPEGTDSESNLTDSDKTDSDEQNDTSGEVPQDSGIYQPRDIYYTLFRQILDLYTENHLYSFTQEDVLYKFFQDFLTENPMYFKYFTNYMLGTMDPYSSYRERNDGFLDGDTISIGFGIVLDEDENGNAIIGSVLENSKAEKAGLLPGDKFVSVMGFKVEDLPLDAVTTLIANIKHFIPADKLPQDEEEVEYSFEFSRDGEIIPIKIHKGIMKSGTIDSYIETHRGKEIGVITLSAFLGTDTDKKFAQTVASFYEQGIKHLTIDLRNNGGGNLDYALSMAECFVPNGELLCYYNDRTLEEPRPIYSTTDGYSFDSIAILVNENTASASELFSHILHVKGIAKLIGTPTYGKGIGQTVYSLFNGDYITITTYEILDQNMENYNGKGLKPDIVIDSTEMCYTMPSLMWFNHENYKEIQEGVYSDAAKALEDRLVIMGLLHEQYSDGIFDDTTRRSVYILQLYQDKTPTGVLDDADVTYITGAINFYKSYNYYQDSPYEVAQYMHSSFSQGKRRAAELIREAEKEKVKIQQRDKALEEYLDNRFNEATTETENNNSSESSNNNALEEQKTNN